MTRKKFGHVFNIKSAERIDNIIVCGTLFSSGNKIWSLGTAVLDEKDMQKHSQEIPKIRNSFDFSSKKLN